ncbi:hypothetical protein ACO11K_003666 [Bacillus cytotoxicus]|uniref:hypothetical protein n=1 Tax=unclassified Bacillus cereus group TaxID=2750818 RepID=UPI001F5ACDF5|nr:MULTISPECIES: hypothetical protein [unclassified Bacillus cereus group]
MKGLELFLWIIIFILLGHIVCIKLDLKHLEKRLDNYKQIMDIQNQKIDETWRYINKF